MRITKWQTKQNIRVRIGRSGIVGTARAEEVLPVYVEEQLLIEFLVTDVTTKLKAVFADNLAVVLVELEGVSRLRQLTFEIITEETECAVQGDVWDAFEFRAKTRVNATSEVSGAHRRGAKRIPAGVHQSGVRRASETLRGGNHTAA